VASLPPILDPDARRRLNDLRAALERRDAEGLRDLSTRLVHRRGPAVLEALMASIDDGEALAFWRRSLQRRQDAVAPAAVPAPTPAAAAPHGRRRAQALRRWLPAEWQLPSHGQAA
jgi:hypothetical protein